MSAPPSDDRLENNELDSLATVSVNIAVISCSVMFLIITSIFLFLTKRHDDHFATHLPARHVSDPSPQAAGTIRLTPQFSDCFGWLVIMLHHFYSFPTRCFYNIGKHVIGRLLLSPQVAATGELTFPGGQHPGLGTEWNENSVAFSIHLVHYLAQPAGIVAEPSSPANVAQPAALIASFAHDVER